MIYQREDQEEFHTARIVIFSVCKLQKISPEIQVKEWNRELYGTYRNPLDNKTCPQRDLQLPKMTDDLCWRFHTKKNGKNILQEADRQQDGVMSS